MNRSDSLNWRTQPLALDRHMFDQPAELRPEWEGGIEHEAPGGEGIVDEDWFEFVGNEVRRANVGVAWMQAKTRGWR